MAKRKRADLANMVGISTAESQSQRVETMLIEPRSFSQRQCTFELPQTGILSDDVALQIQLTTKVDPAEPENVHMDLPLMAGALGLIDRCELFFGTTLINQCQNVPHLIQMKNCLIDQDIRDQTHSTAIGAFSGLKTVKGAGAKAWGKFALNAYNTVSNGNTEASQGILGLVETADEQVNKLDHFRTTASATSTPFWCIKLAEIFPVLKQIPIPLFALKERLRVVFHWSEDLAGNRAVACRTNDGSANEIPFIKGNEIVEASCKLSCDLIYYEDEIGIPSPMVRIQEELEKGVSLVMTDYINVISTIPAQAVPANQTIEQPLSVLLGLDGQIVRNLLISTPTSPDFSVTPSRPANRILGNYLSKASNVGTTLQVSINNQNVFPSPLNTAAKLYNEFSQIEDIPLKINRGLYSAVGQVTGSGTGYVTDISQSAFNADRFTFGNPDSQLNFSLNYLGVNLAKDAGANYVGNGVQVGRQPVIVTLNRTRTTEDTGQLRILIFAEVERMMMIKSGNIFMSGQ